MKSYKYFTAIIILSFLFVTGCQSVKKTLSGQKKENSDEFLVKKKNPLVLPPDFDDLPIPQEKVTENGSIDEDIDFSKVLDTSENQPKGVKKKNGSLEKSISEMLNKN